ncbi:protein eva-1 homolog C isoform X2 [Lagopus muta]|uniref:protein eva-1 homolog C isoform X2 n=1 Tax=Lagopus muta TaxID=64668 RepID=UPI00209DFDEB|nr:protein eva-1 homolog C isoform X2 [Lagopus muta]
MRRGDAGQHPRRRQVERGRLLPLLSCAILACCVEVAALRDFSGYLTKLLQNHTAYACDGERLSLHCPRHSTISIQSALYGQDYQMCGTQQPEARMTEPTNCVAPTSLQKVLDECQNLRSCQLLVNSRVFGPDLCPGTTKFLLVSFKCKPTEYKTKSACENQELKLHCQESKFLIIYSATYGSWAHKDNICSAKAERVPQFDCLSHTALEVLSKRCYGKQRCKIIVSSQDFGSPCLPGVAKHLNVSYACGIDIDPKESRSPKKDGTIVSNSLATFAYIRDHPERAALLFVSSVCVGLILTLCALVIRVSCFKDFQKLQGKKEHLVPESDGVDESSESEEEEDEDSSGSELPDELAELYRPSYSGYNSAEAADLAERIERREQIMQEIWMNSGLDMTPPRNMNTFYINEE